MSFHFSLKLIIVDLFFTHSSSEWDITWQVLPFQGAVTRLSLSNFGCYVWTVLLSFFFSLTNCDENYIPLKTAADVIGSHLVLHSFYL